MKITIITGILILMQCGFAKKANRIDIIIYNQFPDPTEAIQIIYNDLVNTNVFDSIRVIGCPIFENKLLLEIDTLRAEKYDLSIEKITQVFKENNKPENIDQLMNLIIENPVGQKIPLSAIASISLIGGVTKKPEIFLPEPQIYFHKNKRAIKISLYLDKFDENTIIELINSTFSKSYSKLPPVYQGMQYELEFE